MYTYTHNYYSLRIINDDECVNKECIGRNVNGMKFGMCKIGGMR